MPRKNSLLQAPTSGKTVQSDRHEIIGILTPLSGNRVTKRNDLKIGTNGQEEQGPRALTVRQRQRMRRAYE